MQRLVIEVDDEVAAVVLAIARETGRGPDAVAGAVFHLGNHMLGVVSALNYCPAMQVLFQSEP